MPYKFVYKINQNTKFQCNLQCNRCTAQAVDGTQCRNTTCIGVPMCWVHLAKLKHLRIKDSTIQGGGKGLFAVGEPGQIVFNNQQEIIDYYGEKISRKEIDDRYGDYTATYGIEDVAMGNIFDSACIRGAAALANTKPTRRACNAEFAFRGGKIIMRATKRIRAGDEIFAYYGGQYLFEAEVSYSTKATRR